MTEFLDLAKAAAYEGGKVLQKYWGNLRHVHHKNLEGDLVTEADNESEARIIDVIRKTYPDHQILSEESGLHNTKNRHYLWVIDPLDGTTNYTHQFPLVAVSIALHYEGTPVVGVVYNPITNEFFEAEAGRGARLNGESIHVSSVAKLQDSLLATGFAYDRRETEDNNYAEFCHLTNSCQGVRRAGSAALDLAYVACGRLDGHWEIGLKPWDVAAGALLITEAGGRVTLLNNEPMDIYKEVILGTNGLIHDEISRELMKVRSR